MRRLAGPALVALLVIGFFWKLVLSDQFTWLASDDISTQVMPWIQFQASEWHAGRIPLWDPTAWGGQPLLAQAIPGTASLLNWPLFLAPLKHGWIRQSVLHWYYVLTRIIAAWTMFALCRDLGRSRAASVIAGVLFGTAGYFGSAEYPQIVNSGIWAPAVFLYQLRVVRGVRPWASAGLYGLFLGLVWLSGHHQVPIFVSITSCLMWFFDVFRRVSWRFGAAGLVIAGLVGALQILPTFEYGRQAVRWVGLDHPVGWNEKVPYAIHDNYAVKPLSVLSIAIPGMDRTVNPHIGAVALALALLGCAAAPRFAVISFIALIFSFGPATWLHGILYATVPLIEKARAPAQALMLVHLGLCALVAFGIDTVNEKGKRFAAYGLLATAALLSAAGFILYKTGGVTLMGDTRFMVTAAAALGGAVLLLKGPKTVAKWALLGLILVETSTTSAQFTIYERQKERISKLKMMSEDADLADFLRKQSSKPFRIEYDGDTFPHNLGDWWGLETFSTYTASAPEIVMRNEPYNPRVQAMLGVRYYLGTKPVRPDLEEVFTGASGRKIFAYPVAFPRAWAVHRTLQVKPAETARALIDPAIDLATAAIVTRSAPGLETCSGDSVRVRGHYPNRVAIEADMRCRGMVVLSETWFPGWKASVDGRGTDVFDVDGMVRGVVVERGSHRIDMVYRPVTVFAGGFLTVLGLLLAFGLRLADSDHGGAFRPLPKRDAV